MLIVILGPTAIGKTSVGIQLAQSLNTEIISADSRQFYKELKIGVVAPSQAELGMVKHHFVGHLDLAAYYNVSRFENDVIRFLDGYFKTNKKAVMVGGSGLYIDAVCRGIDDLPDPDEKLRTSLKNEYKEHGIEFLQNRLKYLDPEYYKMVDLDNPKRILRALEVCIMTGKTYSSLRNNQSKKRDFKIVKIGLNRPREKLFKIIEDRVEKMIEMGLVEEVKSLEKYRDLNSLNTVGYKEIFKYLDGEWSLEKAIEKIKTNTRRYAKRQLTWFKKDGEIKWFHPESKHEIMNYVASL